MHCPSFTAALVFGFCLAACDTSVPAGVPAGEPELATEAATAAEGLAEGPVVELSEAAMQKWSRGCALCHLSGIGGAPRIGDAEDWRPRVAQGKDVLLAHTIEGLNNMPPLGYCMSCEREDFSLLIDFMSGAVQ